jgi:hypothetical protein
VIYQQRRLTLLKLWHRQPDSEMAALQWRDCQLTGSSS